MSKQAMVRSLFTAISAVALSLCAGPLAGRADGYAFLPPPGWTTARAPGHGVAVWVHPGDRDFRQNINVVAQRYRGSLDAYTMAGMNSIKSIFSDAQIGRVQHATVCGSHPSTYLTYAATVHGRLLIYEQMATVWNGVAYVATYTRMSTQPSLPAARSALTTLCGGLPAVGGPAMRSAAPPARPTATAAPPAADYASPSPVGSVAPTITPRPGS